MNTILNGDLVTYKFAVFGAERVNTVQIIM